MKCEKLDVWKKSAALSAEIYRYFSDFRDYGFKDQITRSGLSIPSNIAEGIERESDRETWRFLDIAQASGAELKTQIYIGMKIEYIEISQGKKWLEELESIGKMLRALKATVKKANDQRPTTNDAAPEVPNA
jgi:four helix bundle protein